MSKYKFDMKYEIWCDGTKIAKFVNESDRDTCQDALQEEFPDVKFEIKESN